MIKNTLRWNFNFYFRKKASPLIAAFRLTNKCNLQCAMCGIWQMPEKKVFAFVQFKRIIRGLGCLGCCYVTLSGGEPLLIPNIADYVREVKRQNIFANLVTNGLLINADLARGFTQAGLDTISLSIDGLKETHDRIRGAASYEAAMASLDILQRSAPRVKIVINTVISPWNIDEIKTLHELLSARRIFFKFQPIYRHPEYGKQERAEWHVTPDFIAKLKTLVRYLLKKRNVVNSHHFLKMIPPYFEEKPPGRIFTSACLTGFYHCDFLEDGTVSPCIEGLGWENGLSLDSSGLPESLASSSYSEKIKSLRSCRRCSEILTVCYVEPKLLLPLGNLLYAKLNY